MCLFYVTFRLALLVIVERGRISYLAANACLGSTRCLSLVLSILFASPSPRTRTRAHATNNAVGKWHANGEQLSDMGQTIFRFVGDLYVRSPSIDSVVSVVPLCSCSRYLSVSQSASWSTTSKNAWTSASIWAAARPIRYNHHFLLFELKFISYDFCCANTHVTKNRFVVCGHLLDVRVGRLGASVIKQINGIASPQRNRAASTDRPWAQ